MYRYSPIRTFLSALGIAAGLSLVSSTNADEPTPGFQHDFAEAAAAAKDSNVECVDVFRRSSRRCARSCIVARLTARVVVSGEAEEAPVTMKDDFRLDAAARDRIRERLGAVDPPGKGRT